MHFLNEEAVARKGLCPPYFTKELKDKIHAYFDLGVRSCWLVIPDAQLISVYAKQGEFKNFDLRDTEVVDEVMDIHLSIQKLFKIHSKECA